MPTCLISPPLGPVYPREMVCKVQLSSLVLVRMSATTIFSNGHGYRQTKWRIPDAREGEKVLHFLSDGTGRAKGDVTRELWMCVPAKGHYYHEGRLLFIPEWVWPYLSALPQYKQAQPRKQSLVEQAGSTRLPQPIWCCLSLPSGEIRGRTTMTTSDSLVNI